MAQITAAMVKALRSRTGAGMMECKRALAEAQGDAGKAIEILRRRGEAKAEKKATRTAAEGVIACYVAEDRRVGALAEVNCETDFVARRPEFQAFAAALARCVAEKDPADVQSLADLALESEGTTVEAARKTLVATLGENIAIRRIARLVAEGRARLDSYVHGTRIGVLVALDGGRDGLGRDLAMHVAASRPLYVTRDEVPAELTDKERAIYRAQAEASGKPAQIVERIVEGRLAKFLDEITLLGQPYVKDPERTVGKLLAAEGATVHRFARLEVGEAGDGGG